MHLRKQRNMHGRTCGGLCGQPFTARMFFGASPHLGSSSRVNSDGPQSGITQTRWPVSLDAAHAAASDPAQCTRPTIQNNGLCQCTRFSRRPLRVLRRRSSGGWWRMSVRRGAPKRCAGRARFLWVFTSSGTGGSDASRVRGATAQMCPKLLVHSPPACSFQVAAVALAR